ncbi:uncharacterized protein LOC142813938 isoform X2 [Rhipicephalus microplus]|uniref:uncharacterized protein LOC142813938 isoform X2 n=1 Tax=Rhipicephalus microplus TaxID=6941 RepID=UPI003F6AC7D9
MARQEFKGFNYPVCYTPSCVLLGKRLRAMLNPLVDPCDNFNEHVCGRYEGASFSILEDYDGILQADLVRGINTISSSSLSPDSARKKAANLALGCFARHAAPQKQHDVLYRFMQDERLNLEKVQDNLDKSYESLLTLHVRLSFVYGLGGLFHIRPSVQPGELQILLDTSTVPGQVQLLRSVGHVPATKYLQTLAAIAKISQITLPTLQQAVNLNAKVLAILGSAVSPRPDFLQLLLDFLTTTAAKVSIRGLSPNFFGEALALHTPYNSDTIVEFDQRLLNALESLIGTLNKTELYFWTSWSVLRELGPFVDKEVFSLYQQPRAYTLCIRKVRHVMAAPLAATTFFAEDTVRRYLDAMTRKLVYCVAKNASSWLRPLPDPYSRPPSMSVFVGYPPSEDTEQKMDEKYSAYPAHKLSCQTPISGRLSVPSQPVRRRQAYPRTCWRISASPTAFDPTSRSTPVLKQGCLCTCTSLRGSSCSPSLAELRTAGSEVSSLKAAAKQPPC